MAGGTFTRQDKVRPGAYFNVHGVPIQPNPNDRGVSMMATHLSASSPHSSTERAVINMTRAEFNSRASLAMAGVSYDQTDELSRKLSIMFENVNEIILVSTNKGATQAVSEDGNITSKLYGTFGNSLTVSISTDQFDRFTITVLRNGYTIETIPNITEVSAINSQFVEFAADYELANAAGIALTTGADGADDYDGIVDEMRQLAMEEQVVNSMHIDNMAQSIANAAALREAVDYVREKGGVLARGFVLDTPIPDSMNMICVKSETFADTGNGPEFLLAELASLYAGYCNTSLSGTSYVIKSGQKLSDPTPNDEIENYLLLGYQIVSKRIDKVLVLTSDICTFRNFTNEFGESFSKCRVLRILDWIQYFTRYEWELNYEGKVDNNEVGRDTFKAWLIKELRLLENNGAITGFIGNEVNDLEIIKGEQIDGVYGRLEVTPVDAMEKLYMDLYARQQAQTA